MLLESCCLRWYELIVASVATAMTIDLSFSSYSNPQTLLISRHLQILICQNLRNNLQHPNEYIRGVTLRFLCRIHEEELLEPLVPSGKKTI